MLPIFKTTFGEKLGRYAFAPLRILMYSDKGIKRWASPRSAFKPERGTGFAARNLGETSVVYEEVELNRGELIVVTHAWETMAARIRIGHAGLYGVVVRFRAITWSRPFDCRIVTNGRTLSQGALGASGALFEWSGLLRIKVDDLLDLDVNARPEEDGPPCRVALEFAVFALDEASRSILQRVDDGCSGISNEEAARILQAQSKDEQSVEDIHIDLAEREEVLSETWVIDPDTMQAQFKSQFARSSTEFTRDVVRAAPPPLTKYALFMVPRSGSTMLTELLASTGRLGYPIEYFVPDIVRCFSLAFMDRFESYEDLLLRGMQTPNGIFGVEIEAERFLEERTLFADAGSWRFVYLRREDVLSQAISLATAIQTGVWHRYSSTEAKLALLSREMIIARVNSMLAHERIFAEFFAQESLEPLNLTYEELTANPAAQVARIAEFLQVSDVDIARVESHKVSMRPTAGSANQFYRTTTMLSGGEFYGYNITHQDGSAIALLAGVDRGQMSNWLERPPLLFADSEVVRLEQRVEDYIFAALQGSLRTESAA